MGFAIKGKNELQMVARGDSKKRFKRRGDLRGCRPAKESGYI